MTRKEYMDALSAALTPFSAEIRETALRFYQEMLDDRMEDGMDEAAAVGAMEAPEKIAARMMEEEKTAGNEAAMTEAETGEKSRYTEKRFSCSAADVSVLRICAHECPIQFAPAQDDQITLIYYTCPDDPYILSCEGGVLSLKGERSRGEKKRLFSISLRMLWEKPHSQGITALIPKGTLLEMDVSTQNAPILCEKLEDLSAVALSTQNASVSLRALRCKTLQVYTANASVKLHGLSVKQGIKAETTNARMEGEEIMAGAEVKMFTTNGKIMMAGVSAGEGMILETTNGNITLERLSAPNLYIHSSNGSIRGTLPGKQSDWQIESGTSNGKNSLPARQAGEKPLTVHTSNASIALAFEEE